MALLAKPGRQRNNGQCIGNNKTASAVFSAQAFNQVGNANCANDEQGVIHYLLVALCNHQPGEYQT